MKPCISRHHHPLVVVRKKAPGEVRVCLDLRELNRWTDLVHLKAERIEDLLANFSDMKYCSSLDLVCSYNQIPLAEECQDLVSFTFEGQMFSFCVVPFGYKNGAQALMAMLQRVVGTELLSRILVYIDDIVIPGMSLEEHLWLLDQVLTKMEEANISINLRKCQFLTRNIKFLGFVVTPQGITKDPTYVEAVSKLQRPTNLKSLQRLLGLLNWCSKYIYDFAP